MKLCSEEACVVFEIAHMGGPEDTDGVWRSIRNAQLDVRRWLFGPTRQDSQQSDAE